MRNAVCILMLLFSYAAFSADPTPTPTPEVYTLNFANGKALEVTEYVIDPITERVRFETKTVKATLPLDWLFSVEKIESGKCCEVYRNKNTYVAKRAAFERDGGIYAGFASMSTKSESGTSGNQFEYSLTSEIPDIFNPGKTKTYEYKSSTTYTDKGATSKSTMTEKK